MNLSIKRFLKKSVNFVKVYEWVMNTTVSFMSRISVDIASLIIYKNNIGEFPDLKNPQNFNEKLMWLKLNTYRDSKEVRICADKYKVREYVKEKGCEEILNDIYGVWDNAQQICWDELPQKFAIKCNHGCGYNILCTNKQEFDTYEAEIELGKWINEDFWVKHAEINYRGIPKKIICERYLETSAGIMPNDYKIYYFNGEPKVILVCSEREEAVKLTFYDLDWCQIDIGNDGERRNIPKPKSLQQMIEYGKRLAEGFPFVRIDFYECDGKPIFGEMTFSPAGCAATYYNERGLMLLGEYLKLPIYE